MPTGFVQNKIVPGREFLDRLVRLAPYDLELRIRLARELFEGGQLVDALSEIRWVLARDPTNLAANELRDVVYDRLLEPTPAR